MKRPYLALATFALVAGGIPAQSPRAWASGLFDSAPVNRASFAVLARPVGDDDWSLVVLEQLRARPFCWTPRPDGLVDPTLNRFNYTGTCGRFIDSNGYSLRIGETDLNHAYRLRLQRSGGELRLLATPAGRGGDLLVGRGLVPRRDRDLFIPLQLEPGWDLQRRLFGNRGLNHIYFANRQPLDALLAAAARAGAGQETAESPGDGPFAVPPPAPPPLLGVSPRSRSLSGRPSESPGARDGGSQAWGGRGPASGRRDRPGTATQRAPEPNVNEPAGEGANPGVVALQVIPYVERSGGNGRSLPGGETETAAQGL